MKNWQVTYFLLPEDIHAPGSNIQVRKLKIKAQTHEAACDVWTGIIERKNLDVDPVWKIINLEKS